VQDRRSGLAVAAKLTVQGSRYVTEPGQGPHRQQEHRRRALDPERGRREAGVVRQGSPPAGQGERSEVDKSPAEECDSVIYHQAVVLAAGACEHKDARKEDAQADSSCQGMP